MSAGLPILSSPEKGTLFELLREKDCGVSYACGDEKGLSAILERIAADKDRLREMSSNALKLFNEKFTAEKVYSEMAEYLENIAGEAARPEGTERERYG
jgi:glycosyltransferase involved in cell wall biosynthesis